MTDTGAPDPKLRRVVSVPPFMLNDQMLAGIIGGSVTVLADTNVLAGVGDMFAMPHSGLFCTVTKLDTGRTDEMAQRYHAAAGFMMAEAFRDYWFGVHPFVGHMDDRRITVHTFRHATQEEIEQGQAYVSYMAQRSQIRNRDGRNRQRDEAEGGTDGAGV